MKISKKIIATGAALLMSAALFTGCAGGSKFDGCDEINAAKKLYENVDSGHVTVVDNITGLITQDFTFMYDDSDVLNYSYRGTDGDVIFYEYGNGSEINYCYATDNQWSVIIQGSDEFYNYTRTNRHAFTSQSVISLNESSITGTTVKDNSDGGKTVTVQYDVAKLNTNSGSQMDAIGSFANFNAEITLNGDGYVVELHQWGEVVGDGANTDLDYTTTFTELNQVTEVTRPTAEWEK